MNYVPPPNKQHYYEQVWAFVRQIPHGKVTTYGQITKVIPQPEGISDEDYRLSAARWVGLAMAACPNDVPWHRVVNSQGKISHQSGAVKQKQLLEAEGILFTKDKLALVHYQWPQLESNEEPEQGQLF